MMCWSKLSRLFTKRKTREEFERQLAERTRKDIEEAKRHHSVKTSRGGPNMPRYHRCPQPQCNGTGKREEKIEDGAYYICGQCKLGFFVRRPGRKPHIPRYQHSK